MHTSEYKYRLSFKSEILSLTQLTPYRSGTQTAYPTTTKHARSVVKQSPHSYKQLEAKTAARLPQLITSTTVSILIQPLLSELDTIKHHSKTIINV